ncbi:3-oxoadipate enol-lactonase [Salinarimonas ramus]|uniref:3-oxoadipate enol-lactonase n=1 Tax=Salinarimonas ramus TaxID=690164 RepID=A0A917QA46_9HYPH|nr:3-oxoadipate enol-lactonase [Salinarimonas ramus]GGK35625.1 3-oxoadipate enol-lactonase [Salinarimonas ramus]
MSGAPLATEERRIEVGRGVRLRVRRDACATPDAPTIVLSNSLAASLEMWDAQVALLRTRFHVVRYDTRGHGGSDVPAGPYGFSDLVGDVVGLMDALAIPRATFMGLSLGGMTGLGLAIAHPDRVERLVCCAARADAPAPVVAAWESRIATVSEGGVDAIADETLARWLSDDFRARDPERAAAIRAMIAGTPADGWIACARALQTLDYARSLGTIKAPTLYVVGSDDAAATPDVMRAMAEATPGARLAVIEGGRHLPNVDSAAEFDRVLAGFLGIEAA